MLEQLFGSKTRVKLLSLFLKNPDQVFFVRELTRKLNLQINAIRRELLNLEKTGIIKVIPNTNETASGLEKKYYQANIDFTLHSELKTLFIKSQILIREQFIEKISELGNVNFLLLTGIFTGAKTPLKTDMLIVGKFNREKLGKIMEGFEDSLNHEINYSVMTLVEFQYRKDITDKFLYEILESKKIVLVDKLK